MAAAVPRHAGLVARTMAEYMPSATSWVTVISTSGNPASVSLHRNGNLSHAGAKMGTMAIQMIDPTSAPAAVGGYCQGLHVTGVSNLLFVSGQVPETASGTIPDDFESQCRQAWANVISVVEAAGLAVNDLLKVTTYLSDRRYAEINSRVRQEVLGEHRPALTIIITGIYDERWLLEIEAIAGT